MGTILIIDDQPGTLGMHIGEIIKRGFSVKIVSSCQEAFERYEEYSGDLSGIILDVIMPWTPGEEPPEGNQDGMFTGIYVYQHIIHVECIMRKSRRVPPVGVLTNSADPELEEKIIKTRRDVIDIGGGDGYECPYRIWRKTQYKPRVFVDYYVKWIQEH
jgi:CheY-like chemotaxis protein